MKLQLAKTGKFGIDGTIVTEKDLTDAVETFEGDVPVTLGHNLADFMPAFGWVKSVEYSVPEKILYGNVELSDLLKDAYEQGFYKKWSVGIERRASDNKRYLHHLAFLGATPPKIKDLKIMDSKIINMSDVKEIWTFGEQDTDKDKKEVKNMPEKKDSQELADAIKPYEDKLTAMAERMREIKKEALKSAITGKVPEAKRSLVMELADNLPVEDSIELSDDTGSKKKVSAIDLLTEIFKSIPLPVKPGEMEMGDADKGKEINYASLVKNV
ncbi:MAG: hypothetical protein HY096_09710 [Nitrospinae bacterium]|nr:hypothetical protein [Nitrospinota bacterium]